MSNGDGNVDDGFPMIETGDDRLPMIKTEWIDLRLRYQLMQSGVQDARRAETEGLEMDCGWIG